MPPTPRQLQCRTCLGSYSETFFSPSKVRKCTYGQFRELDCKLCRLTRRTDRKDGAGRFKVKAHNAFTRHAAAFMKSGVIAATTELIETFGWKIADMAHDIEHAFANGCPYCRKAFRTMAGQLHAVTLDIVDPRKPPFYCTNTRWVCMTCNRQKQQTPPDVWAAEQIDRDRWQYNRAHPLVGSLFDGIGAIAI